MAMVPERPATCDPQAHAEYNARIAVTALSQLTAQEQAFTVAVCDVATTLSLRGDDRSLQASLDLLVAVARYTASRITDRPQEF